jgi:hypothetical protein
MRAPSLLTVRERRYFRFSVYRRLRKTERTMLKRYNVGFAIDEDEDGLWVKWSDVEDDADILHSRIAQLEAALTEIVNIGRDPATIKAAQAAIRHR